MICLYNVWFDDPKFVVMSEAHRFRLIMLFRLYCDDNCLSEMTLSEIAFYLRISEEELEKTLKILIEHGFMNKDFSVIGWFKIKSKNESSRDKMRRHRLLKLQQEIIELEKNYEEAKAKHSSLEFLEKLENKINEIKTKEANMINKFSLSKI